MDRSTFLGWIRLGTVLTGAACLFLLPIVTLVWLSRDLSPVEGPVVKTPRLQRVALVQSEPDLPRPRPLEPIYTGSIKRADPPVVQVSAVLAPVEVPIADHPPADAGWRPAKPAHDPLADEVAVMACEDSVREGLPLPTEFFRIAASTEVYRAPGEDPVVVFSFDTFNGLRFPLNLQAHCVFDGTRLARLEVQPR